MRRRAAYASVLIIFLLAACQAPEPPTSTAPGPTPGTVRPSSPPTPTPSPTPTPTPRPTTRAAEPEPEPEPEPGPVIVIDPGHSGRSISSIDRATGLRDVDYPNYPEIYEMFDVSYCVAEGLRADGYRVVLTKKRATASVGLAKRAEIATEKEADLAISVHNDHSQGPEFQATYDQRGRRDSDGGYHPMYRGTGAKRTVFDHPAIARQSQRYAEIIAEARTETQGRAVSVRENSFNGRPPLEPGNLALVQLLAEVPWVYNEMGAKTGGDVATAVSIPTETRYARGLLLGVERAVPLAGGVIDQPSPGFRGLRRCLVKRVEPRPGVYTRPAAYLPDGFAR